MYPDRDLLPFESRPVPMREQVQHGLIGPPRLVVEERVLRESAGVDHAVLRTDVWPLIGRWFAAVIEAGPHESARDIGPCAHEAPPAFRRGAAGGGGGIVGGDRALGPVR